MKKIISLLLCLSCMFIWSGCDNAAAPQTTDSPMSDASEDAVSTSPTEGIEPATGVSETPEAEKGASWSDEEITLAFEKNGLTVMEIKNSYGGYTLVRFYSEEWQLEEGASGFAWFDRETGEAHLIATHVIVSDYIVLGNSVSILTTGNNIMNGHQYFPEVVTAELYEVYGMAQIISGTREYYMPIAQSFTLGVNRPECLTGIAFETENVALGFAEQPGYEAEFYAGYCSIPEMNLSFSEGICTITLYNTILSEDFEAPAVGEGTYQRSFISVECDGEDTVIKLAVDEDVSRYNVDTAAHPVTGLPYAMISFASDNSVSYPGGW